MDTAHKVAAARRRARPRDLVAVGVPKTIDNDVGDSQFKLIDHTPGYGSVAKYWMHMVQNGQRGKRRFVARPIRCWSCRPWAVKHRLHPGRRAAGRSASRAAAIDLSGRASLLAGEIGRPGERAVAAAVAAPIVVVSEGLRRWRDRRSARFVRPRHVQLQPDDRGANGGQLSQSRRPGGQRGCARQRARHRSAARDGAGLDRRPRRSVSQRAVGGAAGGHSPRGPHGDHLARARTDVYMCRYDKVPLAEVAYSERTFPATAGSPTAAPT